MTTGKRDVAGDAGQVGDVVQWEYLRPRQMAERVQACSVVYLPFGSLEWHGLHNPLGLDAIKAHALCLRAARAGGGVVAPPTFWPIGGLMHPWTVRMDENVIGPLMAGAFEQMAFVGFRVVIGVTGHYGVDQVLRFKQAALEVMQRTHLTVYALPEYEAATEVGYRGDHAAKWETSLMQYLFPDLVDLDEAEPGDQPMDGVHGEDPRIHASAETGARTAERIVRTLSDAARRLLAATPRERCAFIEACAAQVEVLRRFRWGAFARERYWEGVAALAGGNAAQATQAFRSAMQDA